MDSNQRSANFIVVTAHWAAHSLKFEKESDEISATGGYRILFPIDVNDVLSARVAIVPETDVFHEGRKP